MRRRLPPRTRDGRFRKHRRRNPKFNGPLNRKIREAMRRRAAERRKKK
ncbi:MAG TPA: hypothetical protein VFA26_11330 [Gemmataceae bacterium]|nr:hypothetical protein [Gemmataceae bacterium]